MRIGVITDEVSQDFKEAMEFAKEYKLDCVELRSAWEKGPFDYEKEDILKIKEISEEYKIPVTAISSPMFKCDYTEENIENHTKAFEKLVEFAKLLGATTIRCFNFFADSSVTVEMVKEAYIKPCEIAKKAGITIVIESEPTTNAKNCADIAKLVRCVDNPNFKALYDPGNNIYATDEIPYPDGYEEISDVIHHIHIKDAVLDENKKPVGVAVGKGLVDYKGLFKKLKEISYNGDIMLETHYRPSGKLDEITLKNPKGSSISAGGYLPSCECMENLLEIINEIN